MATKRIEIDRILLQFYDRPVAKVSLELIFSILMVMFFAIFAVRPTLLTMSALIKEIEEKRILDVKLKQKAAALSSVSTEYAALQEKIKVLDEALPSSPHFDEAIALIEKLASERNLTIVSLQAQEVPLEVKTQENTALKTVRLARPITVVLTGEYPSIRQFVQDIHGLRRTLTVDAIVFTLEENRGKKRLQANMTISIHYFGVEK